MSKIAFLLFSSFALLFFACTGNDLNPDGFKNEYFFKSEKAKDIKEIKTHWGTHECHYSLNTKYPAEELISQIHSYYEKHGFQPQKEDFLNPGMKTSEVIGWGDFLDKGIKIFSWQSQWKDLDGNYIVLVLEYKESPPTGIKGDLNVTQIFMPKTKVAEARKDIKEAPINASTASNLANLLKGSDSFSCHIGRFEVVKFKRVGAFKKFSLKGSGALINSGGMLENVFSNEKIEYLVPDTDKYIEEGKYISVNCGKAISVGGSPFPIEFYVGAK